MTTYAEAYAEYITIPDQIVALRKASQAAYIAELEAQYRQTFPKRKTFDATKAPEDMWRPLQARHMAEHTPKEAALKDRKDELSAWLFDHAPEAAETIIPLPDMREVAYKQSYDYGSQGFGANKYAREWLRPYEALLQERGIPAEIRVIDEHKSDWMTMCDYGLFAPLEDWQYHALKNTMTDKFMMSVFDKHAINARVYFPFMPYEVTP